MMIDDKPAQHLIGRPQRRSTSSRPHPKSSRPATSCDTSNIAALQPEYFSRPTSHSFAAMVVKLRLARFGRKNSPFYNIVVAHAR